MKVNPRLRPFLRDVFSYDISQCHYEIMVRYGLDTSHIDKSNKINRNMQIGIMMKSNPRLTTLLRTVTESTIDAYINQSNLSENDIVIRQYDGLLTLRKMDTTPKGLIPLELREIFSIFITSLNRTMFIATTGDDYIIKGVPNRYPEMDVYIEKLLNINFLSKTSVFRSMQRIKDELLNEENIEVFGIPNDEYYTVILKEYGEIDVAPSMLDVMDIEDIDKMKYFDMYLRPFTESICLEFM